MAQWQVSKLNSRDTIPSVGVFYIMMAQHAIYIDSKYPIAFQFGYVLLKVKATEYNSYHYRRKG